MGLQLKTWKKPAFLALILLLITGLFLLKPHQSGLSAEKFYRYYPPTLASYLELQLNGVQTSSVLAPLFKSQDFSNRPLLPNGLPGKFQLEKLQQSFSFISLSPRAIQDPTLETLLGQYPTLFKSSFSIGRWKTNDSQSAQNFLLVLPLQNAKLSAQQIFGQLRLAPQDLTLKQADGFSYWVKTSSGLSFSKVRGHFLLASSPQAMAVSLHQAKSREPGFLRKKRYQAYLEKLPAERQGTLFLQTQQITARAGKRLGQLATISPFVLGSVEEKPERVVRINLYAPVDLTRILQPDLRDKIAAWLNQPLSLQSAQYLPNSTSTYIAVSGIDRLWDVYSHLSQNQALQKDLLAYQYLLGPLKIDFRKDLVDLLSGETAFVLPKTFTVPTPMLLLSNTPHKTITLNKLTQLFSLSLFPLRLKTEQIGETPIQTMSLAKSLRGFRDLHISYAPIDDMITVAGSEVLQQVIETRKSPANSLAAAPLYRELSRQFPQQALGVAYLNFQGIPLHQPLQAFAITAGMEDPTCLKGTVVLKLKPANSL